MQDVKSLITELMCVKSKGETSCAQRFESFSELLRIAKERPELVYPYWNELVTNYSLPKIRTSFMELT